MLPIAICDDEPMHRQRTAAVLQEKIAGYGPMLRLFASSAELLNAVETEGYAPRIAVLDIQMQEMDGISLARELNQKLPQCAVIFLTAFLSLATEVYEAKHVYFIVKSQLEARIERAVELALKQAEEDPLLLYRCGTVQRAVASREVLYLERVLRRTRVKAAQFEDWVREAPETLLQGRLQALFVRCHQSYWVNLRHITAMERAVFVLSDWTQIPISRTFRDQARVQVYRFWTPELRENFEDFETRYPAERPDTP